MTLAVARTLSMEVVQDRIDEEGYLYIYVVSLRSALFLDNGMIGAITGMRRKADILK